MKTVVRFIVVLAVLALIAYLLNLAGCFKKQPPVIPTGVIDTLHSVNKAGDSVLSLKGNERDFGVIEKRIIDSIAGVYSTTVKNLHELIVAQTRTISGLRSAGPTVITYKPDTLGKPKTGNDCPPELLAVSKVFSNNYRRSKVYIDLANEEYSYDSTTSYDTITALWKRVNEGNLFNRRHYIQLDISTANPETKVTGLMAYRIPDKKPKKFGVGPSAGAALIRGKFQPYIGVSFNWNLIRF
jgi:hypothetical protein